MAGRRIVYMAISADGFIADEKGGVDWLSPFPAEEFGYRDFLAAVSLIVMGRRAFEELPGQGAWPFPGLPVIVLSTRRPPRLPEGAEWCAGGEALRERLERPQPPGQAGNVWIFGGGETVSRLMCGGLIDEFDLCLVPVLLGTGISLAPALGEARSLRLISAEVPGKGVVRLRYAIDDSSHATAGQGI